MAGLYEREDDYAGIVLRILKNYYESKGHFQTITETGCNVHSTCCSISQSTDTDKISDLLDFVISKIMFVNFIRL